MHELLWKTVDPDFRSDGLVWQIGSTVEHPSSTRIRAGRPSSALSVWASAPGAMGLSWPCRLLQVRALGDVVGPEGLATADQRLVLAVSVVAEFPVWQVFGPNGTEVITLLDRLRTCTGADMSRIDQAWNPNPTPYVPASSLSGPTLDIMEVSLPSQAPDPREAARKSARLAALAAARADGRSGLVLSNAAHCAETTVRGKCWTSNMEAAVASAADAVAVADLVTDYGPFRHEHLDLLLGPVVSVLGEPSTW